MASDQTADMPARLRAMAAEWDDPMCSENPVHPLLLGSLAPCGRGLHRNMLPYKIGLAAVHVRRRSNCLRGVGEMSDQRNQTTRAAVLRIKPRPKGRIHPP